ncbi:ATP-grasp domain-containing protein [Nocardia sp. NBC_01503]|uniref:ATP-grasp domain-containing protein n=1 Tax=Nocardia sp. NBC_01503 TaxID=2975997 RepID=UPI002E7B5050|nr:ATP-grasp domain-containing protein [Nocardia sp. NBC_01503]WTL34067.1 ATP-grasp domain-containing protein [Nocardia sp. NBC_01503]
MRLLRQNPDGVEVVIHASNVDPGAAALSVCDVPATEPRHVGNAEYAEFALDFCRRNHIDVLIPPRRLTALAGRAADFAAIGTSLMCSPLAAVRTLTDKVATYESASAAGIPVPPWRAVNDAEGLYRAVAELSRTDEHLCIKPSGEYSAFGFRVLDDRPLTLATLLAAPQPIASVDAVAGALRRAAEQGDRIPELLVMPFLDGPEISIDCLSAPGGELLVGIPRSKQGRFRLLLDDPAPVAIAERLVRHFELAYLTNTQLRHRHGEPVLLEVNPRPSAGLFQTAFADVNLPWAAVRVLLQGDSGLRQPPRLGACLAVAEAVMEVAPRAVVPDPVPAPVIRTAESILAPVTHTPGALPVGVP